MISDRGTLRDDLRKRLHVFLLIALLLAIPSTAAAVNVRLAVGAHYWFAKRGLFDVTLAVDGRIVGPLYIGGRVGAALQTDPTKVLIPIDLLVGLSIVDGLIYIEGSGGPWIAIDAGDLLRGHAALGFGFNKGLLTVGIEVGYLEPSAIIGLRIGLRF